MTLKVNSSRVFSRYNNIKITVSGSLATVLLATAEDQAYNGARWGLIQTTILETNPKRPRNSEEPDLDHEPFRLCVSDPRNNPRSPCIRHSKPAKCCSRVCSLQRDPKATSKLLEGERGPKSQVQCEPHTKFPEFVFASEDAMDVVTLATASIAAVLTRSSPYSAARFANVVVQASSPIVSLALWQFFLMASNSLSSSLRHFTSGHT